MCYQSTVKYNQERLLRAMVKKGRENGYDVLHLTKAQLEELLPMKKRMFITFIHLARDYYEYNTTLTAEYGFELYSYPSATTAANLLTSAERVLFDTENQYIDYYIHELNFGTEWQPNMLVDKYGNDVMLRTVDDLWDVLLSNIYDTITENINLLDRH